MALIVCPECGKQISDQATVCPSCGVPLTGFQPQRSAKPAAPEQGNKTVGRILGAIFGAIGGALGAYLVLKLLLG